VRPEVDDSQTFNTKCGRTEQSTAILGCYVDDRIYLYYVTDSRLNGIKEVTAAHEMLHAAYQRMSDTERAHVNKLVEAEYQKLTTDPDFAERMAYYARNEPGERDNELHSIIGTEVANINPELEAHYAKYFTDRSKIVALHDSYDAEFTKLDKEAKALSVQLDTLSKKIDSDSALYNDEVKNLNKDISSFNKRASSGQFSSQAAFNSERQGLQQRVTAVSSLRSAINAEIDKYETLRTQYNDTVTQSRTLYQSIDSTLAPTPNV
jgi:predicted  nucleic acid-binding Zn-ribbon protein